MFQKLLLTLCLGGTLASAATINYTGTIGGLPVDATIAYTFGTNSLQVVITNNQSNPTGVAQAVGALDFSIVGGLLPVLQSVSGQLITVAAGGTFTNVAGTPNWGQTATYEATWNTGGSPDNALLGNPGAGNLYSNANGSIAGNGTHNPFVQHSITLNYTVAGATANTNLSALTIFFNTDYTPVTIPPDRIPPSETPEPSTAFAVIGGAAAVAAYRRIKR